MAQRTWPKFLIAKESWKARGFSWQKVNHNGAYLALVRDSHWETRTPWCSNKPSFFSIFSTVDVIISSTDKHYTTLWIQIQLSADLCQGMTTPSCHAHPKARVTGPWQLSELDNHPIGDGCQFWLKMWPPLGHSEPAEGSKHTQSPRTNQRFVFSVA